MPRTARFTREDWATAAMELMAAHGPSAVAVEPVAASLGVSKSSFYWLFENRQALLEAALVRWEHVQIAAVTPVLELANPADRLRRLSRHAFAAANSADLVLRLLTESDDPVVRSAVRRVTLHRLEVIENAFAELGFPPDQARHHANVLYSAYLGTTALRRADLAPEDSESYIDALLQALGVAG